MFYTNTALKYGIANERISARKYQEENGRKIKDCELFIDITNPFLSTSPNSLIEINCPYSARNTSRLNEVSQNHNIGLRYTPNAEAFSPMKHKYFYQIQGQIAITV